jgi:hypothetical protein
MASRGESQPTARRGALALRRGDVLLSFSGNWMPPRGIGTNKNPGLSAALVQKESASNSGGWISIKLKAGVLRTRLLRVGDGENKQEG